MSSENTKLIAQQGNIVHVDYTGTLADGSVFDTSVGKTPLQFQVGAGQMIAGFDSAVLGMLEGSAKTVTIPCEQAYGAYRADLIEEFSMSDFPEDLELKPGVELQGTTEDGHPLFFHVKDVLEDTVLLDANHQLAGKDLTFEITLLKVLNS